MNMPLHQGTALQLENMEPPIWQPLPPSVPIAAADDGQVEDGDAEAGAALAAAVEPAVHATRRAPARRANSVTALLVIGAMVALGGVSFAVGRVTSTGQSGTGQTSTGANGLAGQNGGPGIGPNASGAPEFDLGGRDGGFGGAATMSGAVVGVTSTSITVQLADGQTVTVATGSSTTYHAQTAATSIDVTTGATVTIKTTAGTTASGTASASASPATTTRTATDVTITAK